MLERTGKRAGGLWNESITRENSDDEITRSDTTTADAQASIPTFLADLLGP